jgi:hypothetical protein
MKKSFFYFIEKEEWYVVTVNANQYVFGAKSQKTKEIICLYSFQYEHQHNMIEINSKYHRSSIKNYFPSVYDGLVEFLKEKQMDCFVRTSTVSTIGYKNKRLPLHYTGSKTEKIYNWLENAMEIWEGSYIQFQNKQQKITIYHTMANTSFELGWENEQMTIEKKEIKEKKQWQTFFLDVNKKSTELVELKKEIIAVICVYDKEMTMSVHQKEFTIFKQKVNVCFQLKNKDIIEVRIANIHQEIKTNEEKKEILNEIQKWMRKERIKAVVEGRK